MSKPIISFEGVTHEYVGERSSVRALDDFSLQVEDKEVVCLLGPSGCGKTTMLNLIAGFMRPTKGRVQVNGQPAAAPDGTRGVVSQAESVFPWMNVSDNVAFGLRFSTPKKADKDLLVQKYLDAVGLSDHADKWPRELSGGMKKRVELARSFAPNPKILLLDEPFGSLDVMTRETMQVLLTRIWVEAKKTVVLVTHDVEEALFLGTRVVLMTGSPGKVRKELVVPFSFPRDPELKLTPQFVQMRHALINNLRENGSKRTVDTRS